MRAIRVVIAEIVFCESKQVSLVEDENVIQKLAATVSDPTFRYSVLPWAGGGDADRFQADRHQEISDLLAELAVTIEYRVAVRAGFR